MRLAVLQRLGAALALVGLSFAVAAQQEREPAHVLVSASRLGLAESAVGQHVSVFTREQIERESPASVGEFLARHAGGVVDRGFRSGGFGSLYLRGADPSHIVVLVDGIRQNDPLSSRGTAVDLNTLPIDDVERIEIVRGNTSVVYGEALAGVVHIFTRAHSARSRATATIEAGGGGLRSASGGASLGPWHFSASHREDGQTPDAGTSRVRSANLGFREQWGATALRARVRVAESESLTFPDDSGGPQHAVMRTLEQRRSDLRQLALQLDYDLGSAGSLGLQLTRLERDGSEDSPGVAPGVRDPFGLPPVLSESEYRRKELQFHWRGRAGERWEFLLGAQTQAETGRLDSSIFFGVFVPANFQIERKVHAVVAEARRSSGPWDFQMGLRHENSPGSASMNHPALSLQYRLPRDAGRVGAGWSSASKLPSFFALGHPIVGNPQLKPERSRQAEVFYAYSGKSPWRARVTLFRAQFQDLVDFDAGPPPQLVNRARILSTGLELSLAHEWQNGSRAFFDATAMSVRDPDGGLPLRYRPRRQASAGVEAPLASNVRVQGGITYVGRRFDSSIPTGDSWLSGYALAHISLTWHTARWQVFAAIDNALDRHADETIGTRAGARRLRAGLRWSL